MYCSKCGNQVDDTDKFCDKCGSVIEQIKDNSVNGINGVKESGTKIVSDKNGDIKHAVTSNINKNLNNRKYLALFLTGVVLVAAIIFSMLKGEDKQHIDIVKNGSPQTYQDYTYGDVFNNFFTNPKWKYFVGDGGEEVVEFTGGCTYRETDVDVCIQFILNMSDNSFEVGAFDINKVPQNKIATIQLIDTVFGKYADSNSDGSLNETD